MQNVYKLGNRVLKPKYKDCLIERLKTIKC